MRRLFRILGLSLLTAQLRAVDVTDAFGYHLKNVAFSYNDIASSGTPISNPQWIGNADDGYVTLSLPFSFRFYGNPFSQVTLSSNGYLQFGASSSNFAPDCLGTDIAPNNIVAAFWTDLDPGTGGSVQYQILGTSPTRTAVIQFTQVPPPSGSGYVSFQILLYEGSNDIEVRYLSTALMGSGASAAAGLRSSYDCPNHSSLPFSCETASLTDGLDLYYAYPALEPLCGTPTLTPTFSVSPTISPTFSISPSFSASPSPSASASFSSTPSQSPSQTASATLSGSPSSSPTASPSSTSTPTASPSDSASASPSASPSDSPSATATSSASPSVSPSFSVSPSPSGTPSITVSPSASPTPSRSASNSPSPTLTASPSNSPSATVTPTASPSATATPSMSPSTTATVSSSPSRTPTFTPSPTPSLSPFPPATKPACAVLGEPNFNSSSGIALGASSLSLCAGVALDLGGFPYRLYVADTAHHRILIYSNAGAVANGGAADGVIGQANFSSASANRGGAAAANTLSSPTGISVDLSSGDLWVADSGNHRLLRFSSPVPLSGATASRVLGQGGSFSSAVANLGGVSANSLSSPSDLSIDSNSHLAVADSGNHRVLRFDLNLPGDTALNQWGQSSMSAALPNEGGSPSASSLLSPSGVLITASDLWVSDTGNHRVLRYDLTLITPTAELVLGQPDFSSHLANQGSINPSASTLNTPAGLGMDSSQRLFVCDSLNNRVVGYNPPYSSGASLVYGQASLSSRAPACSSDGMNLPEAVGADSAGNLLVADSTNLRLLLYGCNAGVGLASPTPSITPSRTLSSTPSSSPSSSPTATISATSSATPSSTLSPSFSASPTQSLSWTPSPSATMTPTASPTFTVNPSHSPSRTPTPVIVPTRTPYPHTSDGVISYPNPATRASAYACISFPPGTSARITVYDLLLEGVRHLEPTGTAAGMGVQCWDLRNDSGAALAPGIYYIQILVDGKSYLGKMTLL